MGIQLTARRQSIMALQALLVTALASSCIAAPTAPVYAPAPAYAPVEPTYPDEAPVYQYTYAVKDDYSFSNFNAHEERDGYNTAGAYQVALPDGRTQTVTYTATKDGYIADVKYDGEAKYPEYIPTAPVYKAAPAPVVKAAPVYHAAPVVKAAPVYHAAPAYTPAPAPAVYKSKIAAPAAAPAEPAVEAPVEAAEPAEEPAAAPADAVELRGAEEVAPVEEPAAPAAEEAAEVEVADETSE